MKKLLALILSLSLVFSLFALVSCTGNSGDGDTLETLAGKTPEELYQASQLKLKEAESYYVKSTQDIVISNGNESTTMVQLVETKVNGENSYMKTQNSMEPEANMEAWYVDGVAYASMAGQKIKATITKAEYMQKYMGADPSESTLLDIPESWFEDIKFEKEDDSWVLNFRVSGEKYTQVFQNVGLSGASIGDTVTYKIYFDEDGNLEKMITSFDMKISTIDAHCESVSIITIAPVEVAAPEDAASYNSVTLN